MSKRTTRRDFLKHVGAGVALPFILTSRAKGQAANEKLNVAFIGSGGMGGGHVNEMAKLGQNGVVLCDVDTGRMGGAKEKFPQAKTYQDYRIMLEKEQDNIDAVMIGTPDHHHYPATIIAMQLGLHVYTQKPLTQTIWEARELAQAADEYGVVTQMGNQGHAGMGWRNVYKWIRSGKMGDIVEVHTWTNRPIWPQGIDRPEGVDPVPDTLDWDVWLGPAPVRPFKADVYHPFKWRGWWDFGAGALGDMACHTMDGLFWALDPGFPTAAEPLVINEKTDETFPKSSVIKWEFPEKDGRPAFNSFWYDGNLKPDRPEALEEGRELPNTGNLFIGTKGSMIVAGDYGDGLSWIPENFADEAGEPEAMLEPSPGGNYNEWVLACKGEAKTMSNFAYAGPMTETILLGNIAVRMGERLEWDGEDMKITNIDEANQYVSKEYREGWEF